LEYIDKVNGDLIQLNGANFAETFENFLKGVYKRELCSVILET
jgi:predicted SprT family Zn-dependent metalloprotease